MGRRLGQHFLFDRSILGRIAAAACPGPGPEPLVLEIGPGPGGLTEALLPFASHLVAIELDPALAGALRVRFAEHPSVTFSEGDVLQTDLSQWGPCIVCGNLPYYITSPIVSHVLALGPLLRRAVFLVQREVAQRICAPHGTRDYGFLSASVQAQCKTELLFVVKPGAFRPPPKVDSAVIRLTPLENPVDGDLAAYRRFISLCFRLKRKNLKNNLSGHRAAALLASLPEATLRAEQLSPADLARLRRTLEPAG